MVEKDTKSVENDTSLVGNIINGNKDDRINGDPYVDVGTHMTRTHMPIQMSRVILVTCGFTIFYRQIGRTYHRLIGIAEAM